MQAPKDFVEDYLATKGQAIQAISNEMCTFTHYEYVSFNLFGVEIMPVTMPCQKSKDPLY